MGLLWTLIIGGLIGWVAGMLIGRNVPGGIIGNIIAGIVGAWLGAWILGDFGPSIGGFFIVPALLGAIVVVLILSALMRGTRRV
jgi:uncharacterized membrane protein YeaQ/YmgE (transglycosylase-associated protein family)